MVLVNSIPFGEKNFPNGETIYNDIAVFEQNVVVKMIYENDSDIAKLMMVSKFLDNQMVTDKFLYMDYVPYSRMDRKIDGFAFSLKFFCQIINDMKFDRVYITDPHSNVTPALLDRVVVEYPHIIGIPVDDNTVVFYPDNGAVKKYSEYIYIGSIPYFYGNKQRDLSTGRITKYELVNAPDIQGKDILIIDDICVKGGTFILAAQALKAAGAKTVNLYVTHMERAIYDGEVLTTDWIDHVYTMNTMGVDICSDKITVLEE